jgi:hypothetical protein
MEKKKTGKVTSQSHEGCRTATRSSLLIFAIEGEYLTSSGHVWLG